MNERCTQPARPSVSFAGRVVLTWRPLSTPRKPCLFHQSSHCAARYFAPLPVQLAPNFAYPVDTKVLSRDALDFTAKLAAVVDTRRVMLGLNLPGLVLVVGRWGERQHFAERPGPVLSTVRVNKPDHALAAAVEFGLCKKADALGKISFARRSSRFSRSSSFEALTLVASDAGLAAPLADLPWSICPGRSHFAAPNYAAVSGVHPIFEVIDSMAAHCERCSCSCSNTMRSARSPTSGEYRFDWLMLRSAQASESAQIPARFTLARARPLNRSSRSTERRSRALRERRWTSPPGITVAHGDGK